MCLAMAMYPVANKARVTPMIRMTMIIEVAPAKCTGRSAVSGVREGDPGHRGKLLQALLQLGEVGVAGVVRAEPHGVDHARPRAVPRQRLRTDIRHARAGSRAPIAAPHDARATAASAARGARIVRRGDRGTA